MIYYLFPQEPKLKQSDIELKSNHIELVGTYDFGKDGICQVLFGKDKDMYQFAEDIGYELHPDYIYQEDFLDLEDAELIEKKSLKESTNDWNKILKEKLAEFEDGYELDGSDELLLRCLIKVALNHTNELENAWSHIWDK